MTEVIVQPCQYRLEGYLKLCLCPRITAKLYAPKLSAVAARGGHIRGQADISAVKNRSRPVLAQLPHNGRFRAKHSFSVQNKLKSVAARGIAIYAELAVVRG